eukprot:6452056-Prymnesium_polylepis.1
MLKKVLSTRSKTPKSDSENLSFEPSVPLVSACACATFSQHLAPSCGTSGTCHGGRGTVVGSDTPKGGN